MRWSCGELLGTTCHTAAVGLVGSSVRAGLANTTPGVSCTAVVIACSSSADVPAGSSATSTSGPLKPGPKPSASRS